MKIQLSQKQMNRIEYESMLLKTSPEQLYYIAPHLFHEGITAANTEAKENTDVINNLKETVKEFLKESDNKEDESEYHSFY